MKRLSYQDSLVDIMPTILDISGASYPQDFDGHGIQNLDGESLVPLFRNAGIGRDQPPYWEHEGNCAVRVGDWKLVREHGRDWELYNMIDDRTELNNLRHKSKHRARQMIKEYEGWADEVGVIDWSIMEQHPAMDWHKPQKPEN